MSKHASKRTVVIGMLGTEKDGPMDESRWAKWRPTVSIVLHPDFKVDRLELLVATEFKRLGDLVLDDVKTKSPETKVVPHPVRMENPWGLEEMYGTLYDFFHNYPFNTDEEEYYVHLSTGTHIMQICLFLLIESRHIPGKILETWRPRPNASDRGTGTDGTYSIIDLAVANYASIADRFKAEERDCIASLKDGIDTKNEAFNRIIERIAKVCIVSTDPMLITGPTGAGKTRLARLIFDQRKRLRRTQGDFVEVNCATLRGDAAMSTLFGHVKGAFTGAMDRRDGLLKAADHGMLFLDEIGELGLDEQSMLLRAIEEKRFYPMGADKEDESDFQLICGTNRSLEDMVGAGTFRADLLARINLWTFDLPGLSERTEDIAPNVGYELDRIARKTGTRTSFHKDALRRFLTLSTGPDAAWPGNFRDLSGAITRMATLAEGGIITVDDVTEEWGRLHEQWTRMATAVGGDRIDDDTLLRRLLGPEKVDGTDLFDRVQLACVVRICRASPSLAEAGRRLFAASRNGKAVRNDSDRLRKYLWKFGLKWDDVKKTGR